MIMSLSNYDITKFDFVYKNCDLIDYIQIQCFKKFDSFRERIAQERLTNVKNYR